MFDYLFITHLPSFYKVNLYNKLAEKLKIMVVFVGKDSEIRTSDFAGRSMNFDYIFLSDNTFENRSKTKTLFKLLLSLIKLNYKKLVVGGWELPEFWLAIFLTGKNKNCLALESSDTDSETGSLKGFVKRVFLSRIVMVFASGQKQKILLNKLGYKGEVIITKGVGLMNHKPYEKINKIFSGNFLYVGRLSEEKNIFLLLEAFKELPKYTLTIAGDGPLLAELKKVASQNVKFLGHISNEEIDKVYLLADALILPSTKEPWGLVVEEALYYGLPVIISSNVGCNQDLVLNKINGLIFESASKQALKQAIIELAGNYSNFKLQAEKFDLKKKDEEQVNSYLNLFSHLFSL